MSERLETLLGPPVSTPETEDQEMAVDVDTVTDDAFASRDVDLQLPRGWKLLKDTQWKPSPIGV